MGIYEELGNFEVQKQWIASILLQHLVCICPTLPRKLID